jgi:hypothetical protein
VQVADPEICPLFYWPSQAAPSLPLLPLKGLHSKDLVRYEMPLQTVDVVELRLAQVGRCHRFVDELSQYFSSSARLCGSDSCFG